MFEVNIQQFAGSQHHIRLTTTTPAKALMFQVQWQEVFVVRQDQGRI